MFTGILLLKSVRVSSKRSKDTRDKNKKMKKAGMSLNKFSTLFMFKVKAQIQLAHWKLSAVHISIRFCRNFTFLCALHICVSFIQSQSQPFSCSCSWSRSLFIPQIRMCSILIMFLIVFMRFYINLISNTLWINYLRNE